MILASEHVRHAHAGVVHCVTEEERRAAVGAADDEVSDVIRQKALWPVHEVHKFDAPPGRDAEASRRCDALRVLLVALLG